MLLSRWGTTAPRRCFPSPALARRPKLRHVRCRFQPSNQQAASLVSPAVDDLAAPSSSNETESDSDQALELEPLPDHPALIPVAHLTPSAAFTDVVQNTATSLASQWSIANDAGTTTVTLVHHVPHSPGAAGRPFWRDFVDKCRRAWDIMRPDAPPPVLAPASVVRSRLQMVLVADRCGMLPADLLELKDRTLASLADQLDAEGFSSMEMCVSATKASGERLTLRVPLAAIPGSLGAARTCDERLYDYEITAGRRDSEEDTGGDYEEDEEEVAGLREDAVAAESAAAALPAARG